MWRSFQPLLPAAAVAVPLVPAIKVRDHPRMVHPAVADQHYFDQIAVLTAPWRQRGPLRCMDNEGGGGGALGGDEPAAQPAAEDPAETLRVQEQIYNHLSTLLADIPDTTAISVREVREMCSEKMGLGKEGLDGRRALVKRLAQSILTDEPRPDFDNSDDIGDASAVALPMTYNRALAATGGLVLRKLPKARVVPFVASSVDFFDLTTRPFHSKNPVKHIIDIVIGHEDASITEAAVQLAVCDGELDKLPAVARPPLGSIAVNQWIQTAFIPRDSKWDVVKLITFDSGGDDGKVKPQLALGHVHGDAHMMNYGTNIKNGKKVFQYLRRTPYLIGNASFVDLCS